MTSHRLKSIPKALSIYLNELVYELKSRGKKITTLSLGEAYFKIPRFEINDESFETGYHYGESQGRLSLRRKIVEQYKASYDVKIIEADNVLISAGSKPIIFMAMLGCCNPGDEVLIHEPGWLSYVEQAKLAGLNTKYAPYHLTGSELESLFTASTKLVIINNPNNPAGRMYSESELLDLLEACASRGIILLVDEAYSDFTPNKFKSAWAYSEHHNNLIVVNSISKNIGMSGWRIGYAIASPRVIDNLITTNQHLITCAPTVLVDYVADNYDDLTAAVKPQMVELLSKRSKVQLYLEEIGFGFLEGDSTFYIFVDVSKCRGSVFNFCINLLLDDGIAVVPGEAYGDSTSGFIRLSVGTESIGDIKAALDKIKVAYELEVPTDCEISQRLGELSLPIRESI